MNKDIFDEALKTVTNDEKLRQLDSYEVGYDKYGIISKSTYNLTLDDTELNEIKKSLKLGKLYKKFFDKLEIKLRNTFDIDYVYPHEFILGYDIKSEDKDLVKLFKQIKELENE